MEATAMLRRARTALPAWLVSRPERAPNLAASMAHTHLLDPLADDREAVPLTVPPELLRCPGCS